MQRCKRCIMDETDPNIIFDQEGICNHCHEYDEKKKINGYKKGTSEKKLELMINEIKRKSRNNKYDCVLGISGGVDSSYLLHYTVKVLNLRVLAIHVDAGWNSDIAVSNIHKMCSKLGVQLHTVVVHWPTMRELQRAFFFSGIPNQDIPQDHAFMAATIKYAVKFRVKYVINGSNLATESVLPNSWGYSAMDLRHIKDVFKKNRRKKANLRKYPKINLFSYYKFLLLKRINLLNYLDYSKRDAIEILKENYGWIYYGGKHFESRFTKFFQSYFLPTRFGFDKRLAHLSSLVLGGEMNREEALNEFLNNPPYSLEDMNNDLDYILKKLDITYEEWDFIMNMPFKDELDYKNNIKTLSRIKFVINALKKLKNEIS